VPESAWLSLPTGRATPRTLGPFEKGLRMKRFLRWGRTRGPRPRYTHRIQTISAGMGEVCPPRAFHRDGPVPLRRTSVLAPPSRPATGKAYFFAGASFSAHLI
jgi:hypothetical protein